MLIDLSGVIICGRRLEKMVNFLFEISDTVDMVSSSYHEMSKEEYEAAQEEGEYLQRELYHSTGITDYEFKQIHKDWMEEEIEAGDMAAEKIDTEDMTEEEIKEKELRQKIREMQDKDKRIRENSFIKSEEINAFVEEKFKGLVCIQRRVTCKTHCTLGGAAVVYSFPVSEDLKQYFLQMELLTWSLKTKEGGFLADDPAFYRNGKEVCSICSHEGYITLNLNKEQVKQFKSFDIPHYLEEVKGGLEKQEFPFSKETVSVFSMGSAVTTLLGKGLFDYEDDAFEDYLEFYQWFEENQNMLRKQTQSCKKLVFDIVIHLQQDYSLQSFHSELIERQCQRHGWDFFYTKPRNTDLQQTELELKTFLYYINYQGEKLIVGGEYSSDYLFGDVPEVEEKIKNVIDNSDEKVCGITERNRLSGNLFELMREINIYRGIDEFEKYDLAFFRTYLQTLWYEDIKKKK